MCDINDSDAALLGDKYIMRARTIQGDYIEADDIIVVQLWQLRIRWQESSCKYAVDSRQQDPRTCEEYSNSSANSREIS